MSPKQPIGFHRRLVPRGSPFGDDVLRDAFDVALIDASWRRYGCPAGVLRQWQLNAALADGAHGAASVSDGGETVTVLGWGRGGRNSARPRSRRQRRNTVRECFAKASSAKGEDRDEMIEPGSGETPYALRADVPFPADRFKLHIVSLVKDN
jgi:hypothetical protein